MFLATLNQHHGAETFDNCAAQSLATVYHPKPSTIGIESALDQIAEQRAHEPRILSGAFSQPQNVLASLMIDAQDQRIIIKKERKFNATFLKYLVIFIRGQSKKYPETRAELPEKPPKLARCAYLYPPARTRNG